MKEGEEKEEQSAGQSHYNASHARQFVAALVPCPLPYLPARSEGALARVARRIDLPPAHEETGETGRVTGGRGAGDADTTDTTAPAACHAPRGRGSAVGTVGADQRRGGGRRRSVVALRAGEQEQRRRGTSRRRRGTRARARRGETGRGRRGACRSLQDPGRPHQPDFGARGERSGGGGGGGGAPPGR